jgi:hypothetical protein
MTGAGTGIGALAVTLFVTVDLRLELSAAHPDKVSSRFGQPVGPR